MGLWRLTLTANSHTHIHTPCMYVCMCVCMRVCVYVCMHITAFASILSLALEIEVLSFAVNVARYKHLFQKVLQGLFSLGSKTFLFIHDGSNDWKWFDTLAKRYYCSMRPVYYWTGLEIHSFTHSIARVLLTLSWRFQPNSTLIYCHGFLYNVARYKHLFSFKLQLLSIAFVSWSVKWTVICNG